MTRQFESAKLLTEAGISSLKSAVLIVFAESKKMGEVLIKESEIRKQLGSAQWRLRKTEGSK